MDRFLATEFGTATAELLARRQFNRMVSLRGQRIASVSLTVPGQGPRLVSPLSASIRMAQSLGTSFGN
jgi:6-phosphofructokinase 1